MIINVYAIKDVKAGFEPPFVRANDQLAIRDFQSAAEFGPEPNRFKQFPADYELWRLGTYNQDNGELVSKTEYICGLGG